MNTISLLLNGRTVADIALLAEKHPSSITTIPALPTRKTLRRAFSEMTVPTYFPPPSSPVRSASAISSGLSTPRGSFSLSRPSSSRRSSRESNSPGWYNQENNLTLDDFAQRLNTRSKKLEIWQGRCAQNVVMALMRPTPLILFLLNPICLVLWIALAVLWLSSR